MTDSASYLRRKSVNLRLSWKKTSAKRKLLRKLCVRKRRPSMSVRSYSTSAMSFLSKSWRRRSRKLLPKDRQLRKLQRQVEWPQHLSLPPQLLPPSPRTLLRQAQPLRLSQKTSLSPGNKLMSLPQKHLLHQVTQLNSPLQRKPQKLLLFIKKLHLSWKQKPQIVYLRSKQLKIPCLPLQLLSFHPWVVLPLSEVCPPSVVELANPLALVESEAEVVLSTWTLRL